MSPSLDVVIVGYRSEPFLPRLFESLEKFSRLDRRTFYHNNTAGKETLTQVWNRIGAKGRASFVCFLNPDTIVAPEWDVRIVRAMEGNTRIALAGPSTSSGHPGQIRYDPPRNKPPTDQDLVRMAEQYRGDQPKETDLYGFCMVARRDVWESSGRFDERFRLYGQDSEYAWRIQQLGLRTVCVWSSYVFHYAGQSVVEARKNREIDFQKEAHHSQTRFRALQAGKLPRWDLLDVTARAVAAAEAAKAPSIVPGV